MTLAGEATWAVPVMWALTAVVFAFMLLRLYTRVVCLAAYGADDHIYAVAFIFLLVFTVFTHISGTYGFGQTIEDIGNPEHVVKATLYECIGQGFAIVGMAIAKGALGAFLLRLVNLQWHKIAIWVAMTLVSLASIAQVLCFWLSCVPFAYVYDRRIPGGYCPIDTRPTSYILCVSTILVDFFFAIFPSIFVRDLQMPRREKLTIAGSFSLGLIAAAAGIKRTTEVEGLYTVDYLRDSVGLIVWSHAEMSITLICIGIPVCRPLYRRMFTSMQSSSRSTGGYRKQGASNDNSSSIVLQTIGGGAVDRNGQLVRRGPEPKGSDSDVSLNEIRIGVNGPFTRTEVGLGDKVSMRDDTSAEGILGEEYRPGQGDDGDDVGRKGQIRVTETVRVDRS